VKKLLKAVKFILALYLIHLLVGLIVCYPWEFFTYNLDAPIRFAKRTPLDSRYRYLQTYLEVKEYIDAHPQYGYVEPVDSLSGVLHLYKESFPNPETMLKFWRNQAMAFGALMLICLPFAWLAGITIKG